MIDGRFTILSVGPSTRPSPGYEVHLQVVFAYLLHARQHTRHHILVSVRFISTVFSLKSAPGAFEIEI